MKYLFTLLTLFLFTGCIPKQESVKNFFQTDSATQIKQDYAYILKNVKEFKDKINKRNARAFDKDMVQDIDNMLTNLDNSVQLKFRGQKLDSYKDYLQIAFSKDTVLNRNDYLILGLYYQVYEAYDIEDGHKVTSFLYDSEKLEKLYKNLQIIKWKIKVNKDLEREYLFLTWQNNWQVELAKKLSAGEKPSWEELQNLKYIKEKKESLLGYSNFSYEVMLTQMIDRVENSLETLGIEPEEMAFEAIKSAFIFL